MTPICLAWGTTWALHGLPCESTGPTLDPASVCSGMYDHYFCLFVAAHGIVRAAGDRDGHDCLFCQCPVHYSVGAVENQLAPDQYDWSGPLAGAGAGTTPVSAHPFAGVCGMGAVAGEGPHPLQALAGTVLAASGTLTTFWLFGLLSPA